MLAFLRFWVFTRTHGAKRRDALSVNATVETSSRAQHPPIGGAWWRVVFASIANAVVSGQDDLSFLSLPFVFFCLWVGVCV